MSFIAGAFTATWNSLALGQMEDGYFLTDPAVGEAEMIRGDNAGPAADQDGVLLGGNCYLSCILLESNAAALATLFYSGGTSGLIRLSGTLISAIWQPLILTRVSSGLSATPATRTFARAHLAPGQNVTYIISPKLRRIPLRFQIFPSFSGVTPYYWTDT